MSTFFTHPLDNGSTKITPDIDDDNGRITYISTLTHKLKPSDHGKILRCEVEHAGFTDRQINQKRNQYEIDLNLQFKPIGKGNRNVFSNHQIALR